MRICIYGAGAIGGLLGGRLAAAGHDVSLIARGSHLEAMRTNGLWLHDRGEDIRARPACTDDPAEAGAQDYVVLGMKAHGVAEAAVNIEPLLGPRTAVVTIQNGLPWWYFAGTDGASNGQRLECVDPGGVIADAIPAARVIGGVAMAGTSVPEPGVVKCGGGGAFFLGELDGADTERLRALAGAISESGLTANTTEHIRADVWAKLWGNVSFSAFAVLTGAPLAPLVADAELRALARQIMEETQEVAEAYGVTFPISIDERIERSSAMGGHKTSILQDLEAGRPMEVDAMVGSVMEMGRLAGVATPITDMMYWLVRRRAITAGCYPENPAFDAFLRGG